MLPYERCIYPRLAIIHTPAFRDTGGEARGIDTDCTSSKRVIKSLSSSSKRVFHSDLCCLSKRGGDSNYQNYLSLEEPNDSSRLKVHVHVIESRTSGESGNCHDVAADGVDVPRSDTHANVTDLDGEASRNSLGRSVSAQRILSLSDTDREFIESGFGVRFDSLFS